MYRSGMESQTVGLVFETLRTYPQRPGDPPDEHVEFEPESTIEALEAAIRKLGHQPLRLGSPAALLKALASGEIQSALSAAPSGNAPSGPGGQAGSGQRVDAVFNLAEGLRSRNREGWAPSLLEMAGIPCLGSDALSLSLTLDKAWANRFAEAAGIPVAPQTTFASAEAALAEPLPAEFPLFVKPRWEGTAKGIREGSKVQDRAALAREVQRIQVDYAQPALVEAFVSGPEYTVTLIGNDPPAVLPAVQRALDRKTGIGLHALEGPGNAAGPREHVLEGEVGGALEAEMARLSAEIFALFECRDFARVDFRLNGAGRPIFLEINPLPTFATDSTFAILAELEGVSLSEMLGRCVEAGLKRVARGGPAHAP